ncbi:MAG: Fpg/Nei family DNA glycosylase [Caldisericaceae bacterium]
MPEIIEVDFLKQEISDQLSGKLIIDAFLNKEKASNLNSSVFQSTLKGSSITGARRKGKILIIDMSNGVSLAFHFLLTGYMKLTSQCERDKFQAGLVFDDGCLVVGGLMGAACIKVLSTETVFSDELLKDLGIDALSPEFKFSVFKGILLTNKKKTIKQVLTEQSLIAGIGNAYSDEILFEARVSPLRLCETLSEKEIRTVYDSIFVIFEEARKYGGESELSFVHLNGEKGKMQQHFKVHKREGEKCFNCSGLVATVKIKGRTSYFCPECQK